MVRSSLGSSAIQNDVSTNFTAGRRRCRRSSGSRPGCLLEHARHAQQRLCPVRGRAAYRSATASRISAAFEVPSLRGLDGERVVELLFDMDLQSLHSSDHTSVVYHIHLLASAPGRGRWASRPTAGGDRAGASRAAGAAARGRGALARRCSARRPSATARSWEAAGPRAFGRLIGYLKASVLWGEGGHAAAYVREQLGDTCDSPPACYALALAALR